MYKNIFSVGEVDGKVCRQLNYGNMESVDFWRILVYGGLMPPGMVELCLFIFNSFCQCLFHTLGNPSTKHIRALLTIIIENPPPPDF